MAIESVANAGDARAEGRCGMNILPSTVAKEHACIGGLGDLSRDGLFTVRPDVPLKVAVEAAQNLLCSASDIVADGISDGRLSVAELHLIAFALGSARAIHASINMEV